MYPTVRQKIVKKSNELSLNISNLELLGQKEVSGNAKQVTKENMSRVNRKINREVKK